MTEQEVIKLIAMRISSIAGVAFYTLPVTYQECNLKSAKEILQLIREADYKSLPEVAHELNEQFPRIAKARDYVRLAKDQGLPSGIKFGGNPISDAYNGGYLEAQQDMLKANFRKVEL